MTTTQKPSLKDMVDAELNDLLKAANEYMGYVQTAKTQTKKKYYEAKVNKLRGKIIQMFAAKQQLEKQEEAKNTQNAVSTPVSIATLPDTSSDTLTLASPQNE